MTTKKKQSAKITRPTPVGAVPRERLFSLLDSCADRPVIWISAPAGSGKTTLVASYLDCRGLPCYWYSCDEGDADLATFFYYLGLAARAAAPRRSAPLPLLTPEYLAGIPTFTRRYFERLYRRLQILSAVAPAATTGVLVLDNFQDVPAGPFHEMIVAGLDVVPTGVSVIIVSRTDPPPSFARLQANGNICRLDAAEIGFTLDESRQLFRGRTPVLDESRLQLVHAKSRGWAAGMILMLEQELSGARPAMERGIAGERLFDYFAAEVFAGLEQEVREFLLRTAFLPALDLRMAGQLSGNDAAGRILAGLHRHNLFTERLAGSGEDYRFHPLLQEFLRRRAEVAFAPAELAGIRLRTALLLEETGQIEDAARLFTEAGDREGIARLVKRYGRELLLQGRSKTVTEWLAAIPGGAADDPWLVYWSGMAAFPLDLPYTRTQLRQAFSQFLAREEPAGCFLSWAGIVDSLAFGDGWVELDEAIEIFTDLQQSWPDFPSQEIELAVSSRMLMALTLRKTDQPEWVEEWQQRVSRLLQQNPSLDILMDTMFFLSVYHLWRGEYDRNAVLLEQAEAAIRHRRPSPFAVIRIKLMKGIHYWIAARYDDARRALAEGLEISAASGVHLYDSLMWGFRAATDLAAGAPAAADEALGRQLAAQIATGNTLDAYFYHVNAAWQALLNDNPSLAVEHLETISTRANRMGSPYYRILWTIGMAQTAFVRGDAAAALELVRTALRLSLAMKSRVMEWYALLLEARLLLHGGREAEGLLALHRGMSLGRRYGYVHLEFHLPETLRHLCARALAENIEPEYVKGLIVRLRLTPPQPGEEAPSLCALEDWPYPVRIHTLGRFDIQLAGELLAFSGKEQKKPLELLKALIAAGGREVDEGELTDMLWPDADGDQAHKSFETTLARLRRLLGQDEYLRYRSRRVTLNPRYCWVDSLALADLLERRKLSAPPEANRIGTRAIALYKGPFLRGDNLPAIITRRELLKNGLLALVLAAGRGWEEAGDWERAAGEYGAGIAMDTLAEDLYRRLMICHLKLGNHAAVATTYHRCCALLRTELGIEPSPDTTAVYTAISPRR